MKISHYSAALNKGLIHKAVQKLVGISAGAKLYVALKLGNDKQINDLLHHTRFNPRASLARCC